MCVSHFYPHSLSLVEWGISRGFAGREVGANFAILLFVSQCIRRRFLARSYFDIKVFLGVYCVHHMTTATVDRIKLLTLAKTLSWMGSAFTRTRFL